MDLLEARVARRETHLKIRVKVRAIPFEGLQLGTADRPAVPTTLVRASRLRVTSRKPGGGVTAREGYAVHEGGDKGGGGGGVVPTCA